MGPPLSAASAYGPHCEASRGSEPHKITTSPRSAGLSPPPRPHPLRDTARTAGAAVPPTGTRGPTPSSQGRGRAAPLIRTESPVPPPPSLPHPQKRAGRSRSPPPADCPHCGFSTQRPPSQTTSLIAVPASPRRTRGEKGGAATAAPARRLTGNVVFRAHASARCAARYELHFPESLGSATAISLPPFPRPALVLPQRGGSGTFAAGRGERAWGARAAGLQRRSGRGAMRGGVMCDAGRHPAQCRARARRRAPRRSWLCHPLLLRG